MLGYIFTNNKTMLVSISIGVAISILIHLFVIIIYDMNLFSNKTNSELLINGV